MGKDHLRQDWEQEVTVKPTDGNGGISHSPAEQKHIGLVNEFGVS